MVRQVLQGKKRKNLHIDGEGALASAEVRRTCAQGIIRLDLVFGGELFGRSLVKAALALTHAAGIPIDRCGDALSYLRDTNGEPCFGYYYVHDLSLNGRRVCPSTASPSRRRQRQAWSWGMLSFWCSPRRSVPRSRLHRRDVFTCSTLVQARN